MDPFDRSRRIRTSFAEVHVAEAGPADAAPIVFLHGNPDTHHIWGGVVALLKDTHRCIAPDVPGYGASDEMRETSLEAQAAWVLELFDALGLARADLVIHDVGSTHGLAFVAAGHGARVRTLTTFNGNFFPDYRWHFWGRVWRTPILGELTMLLGNESLAVQQIQKAAPKLPLDVIREGYAHFGKKTRRQVLRYYRALDPEKLRGWDERLLAALRDVPVKNQVLWGDRDPYIPDARTADRLGVHGTVHHFEDLSHWAMAEDPERVAKLIADFIQ
jgi:pimeloyl-ACP methyl ester carboxylesterase